MNIYYITHIHMVYIPYIYVCDIYVNIYYIPYIYVWYL